MNTPVWDFIERYRESGAVRLHMPGHKGVAKLGPEPFDLTEIEGADSLFAPDGIIAESEANASELFGCPTFYSTEGSSLCVRAMLTLAIWQAGEEKPLILAARNVHRSFLDAAALLDFDVQWMYGKEEDSYLACRLTAEDVEQAILGASRKPVAVYLTSPDYLGQIADVEAIAKICRRHHILLIVDNAHGAYLKFLTPSRHPIDLGADMACDSAHKTLSVLTGGAYLHLSPKRTDLIPRVKEALSLFASTSPSYLILASLDLANSDLDAYRVKLNAFVPVVEKWKEAIRSAGYELVGEEPLKLTIDAKKYGYEGVEIAQRLREKGIFCEFSDAENLVLMLSPEQEIEDLDRVLDVLEEIPKRERKVKNGIPVARSVRVLSPREAVFGKSEKRPLDECEGKIYADLCVACPPAVTPIVCGEKIDKEMIAVLKYYGITACRVIIDTRTR